MFKNGEGKCVIDVWPSFDGIKIAGMQVCSKTWPKCDAITVVICK